MGCCNTFCGLCLRHSFDFWRKGWKTALEILVPAAVTILIAAIYIPKISSLQQYFVTSSQSIYQTPIAVLPAMLQSSDQYVAVVFEPGAEHIRGLFNSTMHEFYPGFDPEDLGVTARHCREGYSYPPLYKMFTELPSVHALEARASDDRLFGGIIFHSAPLWERELRPELWNYTIRLRVDMTPSTKHVFNAGQLTNPGENEKQYFRYLGQPGFVPLQILVDRFILYSQWDMETQKPVLLQNFGQYLAYQLGRTAQTDTDWDCVITMATALWNNTEHENVVFRALNGDSFLPQNVTVGPYPQPSTEDAFRLIIGAKVLPIVASIALALQWYTLVRDIYKSSQAGEQRGFAIMGKSTFPWYLSWWLAAYVKYFITTTAIALAVGFMVFKAASGALILLFTAYSVAVLPLCMCFGLMFSRVGNAPSALIGFVGATLVVLLFVPFLVTLADDDLSTSMRLGLTFLAPSGFALAMESIIQSQAAVLAEQIFKGLFVEDLQVLLNTSLSANAVPISTSLGILLLDGVFTILALFACHHFFITRPSFTTACRSCSGAIALLFTCNMYGRCGRFGNRAGPMKLRDDRIRQASGSDGRGLSLESGPPTAKPMYADYGSGVQLANDAASVGRLPSFIGDNCSVKLTDTEYVPAPELARMMRNPRARLDRMRWRCCARRTVVDDKKYAHWLGIRPFYLPVDLRSLTFQEGGLYTVVGPRGSGASEMLGLISGCLKPTAGKIQIFDHPTHPSYAECVCCCRLNGPAKHVPHSPNPIPHLIFCYCCGIICRRRTSSWGCSVKHCLRSLCSRLGRPDDTFAEQTRPLRGSQRFNSQNFSSQNLLGLEASTEGGERSDRVRVATLPAHNVLWGDLTVKEHLVVFAAIHGGWKHRKSWDYWASQFDIRDHAYTPIKALNGSIQRRVALACTFIAEPKVVCLHEPTQGLEPFAAINVWDTLSNQKVSRVIITSADIGNKPEVEKAEDFCDEMLLLRNGTVEFRGQQPCFGTPKQLRCLCSTGYGCTVKISGTISSALWASITGAEQPVEEELVLPLEVQHGVRDFLAVMLAGLFPNAVLTAGEGGRVLASWINDNEYGLSDRSSLLTDLEFPPIFAMDDGLALGERLQRHPSSNEEYDALVAHYCTGLLKTVNPRTVLGSNSAIQRSETGISNGVSVFMRVHEKAEPRKIIPVACFIIHRFQKYGVIDDFILTTYRLADVIDAHSAKFHDEEDDDEDSHEDNSTMGAESPDPAKSPLSPGAPQPYHMEIGYASPRKAPNRVLQAAGDIAYRFSSGLLILGFTVFCFCFRKRVNVPEVLGTLHQRSMAQAWGLRSLLVRAVLPLAVFVVAGFVLLASFTPPDPQPPYLLTTARFGEHAFRRWENKTSHAALTPIRLCPRVGDKTLIQHVIAGFDWKDVLPLVVVNDEIITYEELLQRQEELHCDPPSPSMQFNKFTYEVMYNLSTVVWDQWSTSSFPESYAAFFFDTAYINQSSVWCPTDPLHKYSCPIAKRQPQANCDVRYYFLQNSSALHTTPVFINQVSSTLLRMKTKSHDSQVITTNYPLPPNPDTEQNTLSASGSLILFTFVVSLSFAFFSDNVLKTAITERVSMQKTFQLLSGVRRSNYWISSLLWDLVLYIFPFGLVLLASAVFHALNLIVVPIQYLDTMVLLALYGPSSICFAYVVSFAFDDLFRPRFTLAGIHVLTALFASFAISLEVPGIREVFPSSNVFCEVSSALVMVLRLVPSYCMGHGLVQLVRVSVNPDSAEFISSFVSCYPEEEELFSHSTFDVIRVAGLDVMFLGVCCILYPALVALLEIRTHRRDKMYAATQVRALVHHLEELHAEGNSGVKHVASSMMFDTPAEGFTATTTTPVSRTPRGFFALEGGEEKKECTTDDCCDVVGTEAQDQAGAAAERTALPPSEAEEEEEGGNGQGEELQHVPMAKLCRQKQAELKAIDEATQDFERISSGKWAREGDLVVVDRLATARLLSGMPRFIAHVGSLFCMCTRGLDSTVQRVKRMLWGYPVSPQEEERGADGSLRIRAPTLPSTPRAGGAVVSETDVYNALQWRTADDDSPTPGNNQTSNGRCCQRFRRRIARMFRGEVILEVESATLTIRKGEVMCFLGPTEAGKTELVSAIVGKSVPTLGRVIVFGHDRLRTTSNSEQRKCRKSIAAWFSRKAGSSARELYRLLGLDAAKPGKSKAPVSASPLLQKGALKPYSTRLIGYVPQHDPLDGQLSPKQLIYTFGLWRTRQTMSKQSVDELLDQFGLVEVEDTPFRDLSPRHKQFLKLCLALLGPARLLILDEPYKDLTFQEKSDMAGIVSRWMRKTDGSVILCTDKIEECSLIQPPGRRRTRSSPVHRPIRVALFSCRRIQIVTRLSRLLGGISRGFFVEATVSDTATMEKYGAIVEELKPVLNATNREYQTMITGQRPLPRRAVSQPLSATRLVAGAFERKETSDALRLEIEEATGVEEPSSSREEGPSATQTPRQRLVSGTFGRSVDLENHMMMRAMEGVTLKRSRLNRVCETLIKLTSYGDIKTATRVAEQIHPLGLGAHIYRTLDRKGGKNIPLTFLLNWWLTTLRSCTLVAIFESRFPRGLPLEHRNGFHRFFIPEEDGSYGRIIKEIEEEVLAQDAKAAKPSSARQGIPLLPDSFTVSRAEEQRMLNYIVANGLQSGNGQQLVLDAPFGRPAGDGMPATPATPRGGGLPSGRQPFATIAASPLLPSPTAYRSKKKQDKPRRLAEDGTSDGSNAMPIPTLQRSPLCIVVRNAQASQSGKRVEFPHHTKWEDWYRRPFCPCWLFGGEACEMHPTLPPRSTPPVSPFFKWQFSQSRRDYRIVAADDLANLRGLNSFDPRVPAYEAAMRQRLEFENQLLESDRMTAPPCSWEPVDHLVGIKERGSVYLVDVPYVSQEWDDIQQMFFCGWPAGRKVFEIARIQRIQNEDLWGRYVAEKVEMVRKNGPENLNEMFLFHGTSSKDPCIIYEGIGFDMRLASEKNYYGKGIYFAENMAYVNAGYAYYDDATGVYQVLLNYVLCGFEKDYKQKKEALRRPPDRKSGMYDGVVGGPHKSFFKLNDTSTRMHIVYENRRAYPAYLISYRKKE